jgi:tetratricopeptide (TPR) repeat protein
MAGTPRASLLAAAGDLARGDRVAAWQTVRSAAAAAPEDGPVQLLASQLSWLLGDDRTALVQSRTAMALGVAGATTLHVNQARDAGWYHEVGAVLERVTDETAGGPAPAGGPTFAQALEQLVRLYVDHHHHSAAAAALDHHSPRAKVGPLLLLQTARVYANQGNDAAARAAIDTALAESTSGPDMLDVAGMLLELGAFAEAEATYRSLLHDSSAMPSALESLARLCLWRDDLDGALAHGAALPVDAPAARRTRAAVRLRCGDASGALPLLDAALADDPRDGEAHLWRAEANLRLGRRDEGCRDADRSLQSGYSFAAVAIRLLAAMPAPRSGLAAAWQRGCAWLNARLGRTTGALRAANDELRGELETLCPDAVEVLGGRSEEALADLLERALHRLAGNRCSPGTWLRDDGRLALVPPTASPRILSRQALELIRVAGVEESFRRLDGLAARFPDSSMPVVHRGELRLWLGDWAEARADLEAAIAIRPQTRWAWYGLTWLDILAGDPERALDTCARGIRVMNRTEGPVALICRGEAYRVLGRLAEAREQLERSNALQPTRVSGWINLALVHAATGDGVAQREAARHVAGVAPSLLSEAAAQLGEESFARVILARPWTTTGSPDEALDRVFRHTLVIMRGNRASGLITYFTADGQLRHVPRHLGVARLDEVADAQAVERIRRALERGLGGAAA